MAEPDKWDPIESLGVTGTTVAHNVKRLRKERGLAFTELAARLKKLDREIPTLGLRKIESGGRRVDTDDLVALALALGVSPATLLMPTVDDESAPVPSMTGEEHELHAARVWAWLTAISMPPQTPRLVATVGPMSEIGFRAYAWPTWLQQKEDERSFAKLGDELRKMGVKILGDDQ